MSASSRGTGRLSGLAFCATLILCFSTLIRAHEHHEDNIADGEAISPDPIDSILWTHMLVQITTWGILYPLGMVLGIIRSRWHVPVQTFATVLAVVGYFTGHKHHGRQFRHNIHAKFAPTLHWLLFAQIMLGIALKLHIERGFFGRIRKWTVVAHGVVGKALPVVAWTQMLFGGITALGFCRGDHTGQCAAHFIMGSAFIGYGIVLTILLLVGQMWLRRTGKSQEFFDSIVIAAWGCVNTFTEHRWGGPWVRNDLQHTSMGIVWWCAGLVGIWLSRTREGRPKRNLIPGIVIMLTGYGMSAHPQELPLSTMIHSFFGYTLMLAGLTRIIEISFVLKDRQTLSLDGSDPSSFQYIPVFLLYASGFLFMGATEEQMKLLSDAHVTHVSYILILYSLAFLLFLFVNMLLHLYATHAMPPTTPGQRKVTGRHNRRISQTPMSQKRSSIDALGIQDDPEAQLNGGLVGTQGSFRDSPSAPNKQWERQRVRDAQEFELESLIDEESGTTGRKLR